VTPRRRWALISIAAVGTALAAWVVSQDKDFAPAALPAERARAAAAAAPTSGASGTQAEPLSTQLPVRAPIGRQRGDPFAARSWAPPQQPQQQQQQAEAPRAPPNPYRFAGTVHHQGRRQVYLLLGDRMIEAKEGEMLERGFRVKSVSDSAVTIVYEQIPDQPVTIAFTEPGAAAAGGASAPPAASSPLKQ
jgi:hypothetical protein